MKKLRPLILILALGILAACSTVTGTESNHDSISFSHFVKDEGELAFCIAAPDPNPYQDPAEPGYFDFEQDKRVFLVFKFYDPRHFGPRRGISKLHFVVVLKQIPGYTRSSPISVSDLWNDYYLPVEDQQASQRFGEHRIETHKDRKWLRVELLGFREIDSSKSGRFGHPGLLYGTVIWGRYLFSMSLNYVGEPEEAYEYIEERFWLMEKVLNSLTISDNVGEDISVDCEEI